MKKLFPYICLAVLVVFLTIDFLAVNYAGSDNTRLVNEIELQAGCHLLGGEFFEDASCGLDAGTAVASWVAWVLFLILAVIAVHALVVRYIFVGAIAAVFAALAFFVAANFAGWTGVMK